MPKRDSGPLSGQHLIALGLAVLVGAGALTWWWVKRAPGGAGPSPISAEFQAIAKKLYSSPNGVFDRGAPDVLKRSMEAAGNDLKTAGPLWTDLVMALLRVDRTQEAVDEVERMFAILRAKPTFLQTQSAPHFIRGMAYLRLAEIENCVDRHNDECCVFPLKGGGVHTAKKPGRAGGGELPRLPRDRARRPQRSAGSSTSRTWRSAPIPTACRRSS